MANPADKSDYWKREMKGMWYDPESIDLLTDEQRQAIIQGVKDGRLVTEVLGFEEDGDGVRITGFSLVSRMMTAAEIDEQYQQHKAVWDNAQS